ncbi:hypothetical protein D3C80_1729360 [compost metagenome]
MVSLKPLALVLKIDFSPSLSINIAFKNCSHAVQKHMEKASILFSKDGLLYNSRASNMLSLDLASNAFASFDLQLWPNPRLFFD